MFVKRFVLSGRVWGFLFLEVGSVVFWFILCLFFRVEDYYFKVRLVYSFFGR